MTTQRLEASPRATTMAASARDACKTYGAGDTAVLALDHVTLDLPPGQFTAIMGPSGSGKSTLMHCLAGLDTLTSGHVFLGTSDGGTVELGKLNDRQLTKVRREQIGFVFQSFNLIPTLTAKENIVLPMTLAGTKPDKAWVDSVIATVGLGQRLKHRPSELSGGQQQRVAVARALANRPPLVLADEPTGNLDEATADRVLGEFLALVRGEGSAALVATHNERLAAKMDRVVRLHDGVLQ